MTMMTRWRSACVHGPCPSCVRSRLISSPPPHGGSSRLDLARTIRPCCTSNYSQRDGNIQGQVRQFHFFHSSPPIERASATALKLRQHTFTSHSIHHGAQPHLPVLPPQCPYGWRQRGWDHRVKTRIERKPRARNFLPHERRTPLSRWQNLPTASRR